MKINSIAIFCGSQSGRHPLYEEQAVILGRLLAMAGIHIVYGGGNKGLMGAVANSALEAGGRVTGIIPSLLSDREHLHTGLSETLIVENMHIRKGLMYEKSDAAIILPGGYGTLDELFEMLTWNQLDIHNKQIFLLNTSGFYDFLINHIYRMFDDGLLYSNPRKQIHVLEKPEEISWFLAGRDS